MTDSNQVDLFFRYKVTNPALFQKYLDEALPVTEREPYVLDYNLFRDSDGIVFQHERYEDEAAIGKHMEATAEAQKAHAESTEFLDIRVVGKVSDEFKAVLVNYNPTFWDRFRSVDR